MTTQSSAKRSRLPQRTRAKVEDRPVFRMTRRDEEILRAVYAYQALTTQQISDLLFVPVDVIMPPKPHSRVRHRLKGLYHHGLLSRHEQPHILAEGRKPFLYQLDRKGAEWLAHQEDGGTQALEWKPGETLSALFLEHLLAGNNVRIAIVRSAARHGFTIETWLDERTLKQVQNKDTVVLTSATGKKQKAAVVPDGYYHLRTDAHHYYQFIEIDRASVTGSSKNWTRRTWARKVHTFLEYYRSGKYHARYHTKSMRVLTVTTGQTRLANLRRITEENGGKARFWFTTFERVLASDILTDPIWEVAGSKDRRSLVW